MRRNYRFLAAISIRLLGDVWYQNITIRTTKSRLTSGDIIKIAKSMYITLDKYDITVINIQKTRG